jgi:outer membrane protein with beta-barrel domain
MQRRVTLFGLAILALAGTFQPAAAQMPARRFFLEGLGGAVVPTFDISDVAKTGWAVGGTLGYHLNDRWQVMGEFDYGRHKDEATGNVNINTLHYIGKVGYSLTGPKERGWEAAVNLGAGAVTFDVQGAPQNFTYFAINAGAKIGYNFNPQVAFIVSPQGDIAFSDETEVGTSNSWVWPVTAGLRVSF